MSGLAVPDRVEEVVIVVPRARATALAQDLQQLAGLAPTYRDSLLEVAALLHDRPPAAPQRPTHPGLRP